MPRPAWIPVYLKVAGWPDDWQNSLALDLWAQSEGMPDSWHNWLATGLSSGACTSPSQLPDGSGNTYHVAKCDTAYSGAINFRDNIYSDYYVGIPQAFKSPVSKTKLETIYLAINRTAYCPNCQGGRYPIALYNYVYGRVPPKDRPGLTKPPPVTIPKPDKPVKLTHAVSGWARLTRVLGHDLPIEAKRLNGAGVTAIAAVRYSTKRPRKP